MIIIFIYHAFERGIDLTGSALANAFNVLKRKPMILLLLFPIQALAPLFLLVIPLFSAAPGDDTVGLLKILLVFGIIAIIGITALARAILLIPAAMELLHDGAAGADTPAGWYRRSLGKHWWKQLSLSIVQGILQFAESTVLQFIMSIAITIPFILFIPFIANDNSFTGFGFGATLFFICLIFGIVSFVFQFFLESLFAYLLPAITDRSAGKAIKAIFSGRGMRKAPKLLGGRLLIGTVSTILYAVAFFCFTFVISAGAGFNFTSGMSGFVLFVCILCSCLFVTSYLSVYRNAFEFCVFQQIKKEEAETVTKCEGKILTEIRE
jgi:hypothetical protein